jgi:hypothetical protein
MELCTAAEGDGIGSTESTAAVHCCSLGGEIVGMEWRRRRRRRRCRGM